MDSTKHMDSLFDKNEVMDQLNSMSTFKADLYNSNFQSLGSTPRNPVLNSKTKALLDSRKRNLSVGFSTLNEGKVTIN